MEDARRPIGVAARIGVASSAGEVVARVVLPFLDLFEALDSQLIPFVRQQE
jgi:hypothetical protein